ncbi:hypothetical protein Sango_3035200 [Sesamum angolense]|uniref:Uncharacterized protein n=1 Tax=Sesamum angolense TaxID=2727404 RepID=A0AAE1TB42_9LAMI|nr:hypothetical protein Sango_3035200 [Sesamum angolense]
MAFILPKGIIKEMMKRLRTLLWKGNSGYPKVAWEAVCRPIEEGGLGIKDILAVNRALMSKHLWAVIKQDRPLCGLTGSSRFDLGTVRFGQLRKTKELGVGGKCSHLDIIDVSIQYRVGNGTPSHFGTIRGTRLDLSFLDSPGTSVDQYWTSRQAFSGY